MYKKFVSLSLVFAMLVSILAIPASAADSSPDASEPTDEEIFQELLEQLPRDEAGLVEMGLITPEECVSSRPMPASLAATSYGPYTSLNMPSIAAKIMITSLSERGRPPVTNYKNKTCYQFVSDEGTVYVTTDVFDQASAQGQYPSNNTISEDVTEYLNNGITKGYYSCKFHIYSADGIQYVDMTLYRVDTGMHGSSELFHGVEIQDSVITYSDFAVIHPDSVGALFISKPDLKLQMVNAGSAKAYFTSFYVKGKGTGSSVDVSKLLSVGYLVQQIASSVSPLTIATAYSLLQTALTLTLSSNSFVTNTLPLSSPGENIYVYSCALQSTYNLAKVDDYFQLCVGVANINSGCEYAVTVSI